MAITCPKCGKPLEPKDVSVVYGIRNNQIEILAEGDLRIDFCCGVAILADKPPLIETPPEKNIILL
jgi:hypothetical protein